MGLSAFIADISKPDQRAFRMGMIHLASSLGRPIAAPLGAYLLKEGNQIWETIHCFWLGSYSPLQIEKETF
jgi:hypothetical protein